MGNEVMGNHLIIWIFTKKWEPLIRSNERMKKIWTQISWRIIWSPRYPKHWSRNKVLWENGLESWSHLWLKINFLQLFHRDWWIFQYSNSIFGKKIKTLHTNNKQITNNRWEDKTSITICPYNGKCSYYYHYLLGK